MSEFDGVIYLTNVRLSFPHFKEAHVPKAFPNSEPKFGGDLILPPNNPEFSKFIKRVQDLYVAQWGEHAGTMFNEMSSGPRKNRCFGQGNEVTNQKREIYGGYKDMVYISAKGKNRPQMILPDGSAADPMNPMAITACCQKLYAGCRVNAVVKPWLWKKASGNGVSCELVAIQFAGDDEAFGEATPDVMGMFGKVAAPQGMPVVSGMQMPGTPFQIPGAVPQNPPWMS